MLRFHKKWGVVLEGYSTIGAGRGNVLEDPVIQEIATAKGVSAAQVAIAWGVQRGTVPLVKTSTESRLGENIQSANVQLSEEEVQKIDALNKNLRLFNPIDWDGQRNMPYFN